MPGLRPTAERIRETLFNRLAPHIAGARCLDLFAGTGALGLEALSRGAASATFVESSQLAATTLRRNVETLDAKGATVLEADAYAFLGEKEGETFDIVFLDPPFADEAAGELCRLLDVGGLLADGAFVYIEEDRAAPAVDLPGRWQLLKSKTAGNVRYLLAKVEPNSQGEFR